LAPNDWKGFLQEHLITHDADTVMAGLKRAGWKLTYTSVPTETFLQDQADAGVADLSYSIGLQVRENGAVRAVVWNGPAFRAGLKPGAKITKVNGTKFTSAVLLSAISESEQSPIHLSVQSGDMVREVTIPYADTLRYPKLERIPGTRDLLTPLLAPR